MMYGEKQSDCEDQVSLSGSTPINISYLVDLFKSTPDLKPKLSLDAITPASRLKEDLGFDSLAQMILFVELQSRFPDLAVENADHWVSLDHCLQSLNQVRCGRMG